MCRRHMTLSASLLLAAAACGDDSNGPNGPAARNDIGEMARDEVEAALDALTLPTTLAPLNVGGPPCVTPSAPADTDGDGIPEDATYLFTAPPCRYPGVRGAALDIVGQLRVQDPSATAGFGYAGSLTALRYSFNPDDADDPDYSVTRNGTRALDGTTAGLQLATDLQVVRTFPGQPDGQIEELWTVAFTPEGQLQINLPLPNGTLQISGAMNWTRGEESFPIEVTTAEALHFDTACEEVQRFDAGELRLTSDFGGEPGYIRLRWDRCGAEPAVDFVGAEQE
jgi:hypothetical protein